MNLGILGTGSIVQELLPALGELGCGRTYLLSTPRSGERARGLAERYGLSGVAYDLDQLLGLGVDTVYEVKSSSVAALPLNTTEPDWTRP